MNLNNINLTPHQIAELYSNDLIDSKSIDMPEKEKLSFLGSNKKNIAVLVLYEEVPYLPDEQLNFLVTILGACNLTLTDVAIINVNKYNISYQNITAQLHTKTFLMFDVPPLSIDLPINFPQFQIQHFSQLTFLHAPPLHVIESDKELKKMLWTGLKKIFGI